MAVEVAECRVLLCMLEALGPKPSKAAVNSNQYTHVHRWKIRSFFILTVLIRKWGLLFLCNKMYSEFFYRGQAIESWKIKHPDLPFNTASGFEVIKQNKTNTCQKPRKWNGNQKPGSVRWEPSGSVFPNVPEQSLAMTASRGSDNKPKRKREAFIWVVSLSLEIQCKWF